MDFIFFLFVVINYSVEYSEEVWWEKDEVCIVVDLGGL